MSFTRTLSSLKSGGGLAAGRNQVMQLLTPLWWKRREREREKERKRESANYFTCSTGNKLWGVRWKTATLSSLRSRRYTDFGTSDGFCPFEVGEGTWWVSLIPGRRTDTLYKRWMRQKRTGVEIKHDSSHRRPIKSWACSPQDGCWVERHERCCNER